MNSFIVNNIVNLLFSESRNFRFKFDVFAVNSVMTSVVVFF